MIISTIGSGHFQKSEDERKNLKEYLWRKRKLLETKLKIQYVIAIHLTR